jgi:acetyl esterase/lipase
MLLMRIHGIICTILFLSRVASAQPPAVAENFPAGTVFHKNLAYAGDTLKRHQLDILLPKNASKNLPLVVWVHGGAWMLNDRYADMGYMKNTVRGILDSGYAFATIEYRYSTDSVFPAQIRDCNQALEYLYQNADKYGIDRNRIALIGFSAGGHLASLVGLSNNNVVSEFYPVGAKTNFKIRCVLDFYGPSDFVMLASAPDTSVSNDRNPVARLIGAMPAQRPDLAKRASPVTYVDKNDPPFFIVQGEKDESVPNTQSVVLASWLRLAGVPYQFTMVPGAPHYGPMFDVESIRNDLFKFLRSYLR